MRIQLLRLFLLSTILQTSCSILYSQIDSGYVHVKGAKIFYRIWGEGEPIVFLNGGPGLGSQGYETYATEIEQPRKVILFDQRGNGKSRLTETKEIYMSDMVNDIESLKNHLGINKWDVFGHSFGGQYAIEYIAKYPSSIGKVILSASPGIGMNSSEFFQQRPEPQNLNNLEVILKEELLREKSKLKNYNPHKVKKLANALTSRYYVSKPENYIKVAEWWLKKSAPSTNWAGIEDRHLKPSKQKIERLSKFKNRILIIHGNGDFLNISHPLNNHSIFPNSELRILPESGHIMSIDSKEEYFRTINEFLENE